MGIIVANLPTDNQIHQCQQTADLRFSSKTA